MKKDKQPQEGTAAYLMVENAGDSLLLFQCKSVVDRIR